VHLSVAGTPSWMLTARVGSGRLRVDLPDMSEVQQERHSLRARIGAGEGRVDLQTGSGGLVIIGD
jgi:hypothetical protein